jgi:hypothetical protein
MGTSWLASPSTHINQEDIYTEARLEKFTAPGGGPADCLLIPPRPFGIEIVPPPAVAPRDVVEIHKWASDDNMAMVYVGAM